MDMKYNGLSFYDRLFLPKHDEGAESGLDGFVANMEYDLKMFETVILPFIERERATELKLLKESVAPVHKGKRVQAACTAESTEYVSRGAEMVKLLLDHGADPNLVNAQGDTPLAGVVNTAPEIIEILNKAGDRTTAKK